MSPYYRPMARTWWLSNRAYALFMLRDLTCVFIAAYLVFFLLMLRNVAMGREAYEAYLRFLATPGMIAFHVLALAAALFHTITWFNFTPMVMGIRFGEKRIPARIIVGVTYASWIAVSIALMSIVLRWWR